MAQAMKEPRVMMSPSSRRRLLNQGNTNTKRAALPNQGKAAPSRPRLSQRHNCFNVYQPMYDMQTQNQSFLDVAKQLELLGIKHNKFHLVLLNPLLQGVDPHSDDLTNEEVMMIIQECKLNIFYYLREVVLIEEQGGQLVHFRMDRGTLAALYCFHNNINFYLQKPRQTGKTVGVLAMLSWAFKFSGPNSDMLFACYRPELAKKNLKGMKTILNNLPPYMSKMGTTAVDKGGKTIRRKNNVTEYMEPGQNNSARIAQSAATEEAADTVGRGYTQTYQYFDEAEFTRYIGTIVKVSGMAFNTASRNAANNGSGYCRIFTTTPGDLGNKKTCQSAMEIVNDALIWDEKKFYDELNIDEFKALLKEKSKFRVVYIEYDYKQLGLGEEWFIDACSNVGGDINKIKREILLQRFSGNSDSPFTEEEIEDISQNVKKPIAIKRYNKIYDVLFYEKPRKGRTYIMGLDPAEGTGGDNYAFTIIDPYELTVVAEFKSQYMTVAGCVDLVTNVCQSYFPEIILVIERNRNGGAVVEAFKSSPLRNRVYSSPKANGDDSRYKDTYDDNGFIKEEFVRNKYFGTNTTGATRQVMMNILLDYMHFARHLVNSQYLVDDVKNLVVRNNKIQAASGEHDDSVMSWLIALYVYYYGENLERYGFVKGTIPKDVELDDEFEQLKVLYRNPEIKKQFPTIYAYYEFEKAKHDILLENQRTEQQAKYKPFNIGGLGDDVKVADIPDIDKYLADQRKKDGKSDAPENSNSFVHPPATHVDIGNGFDTQTESEVWRQSVVQKFMSLNK